MELRNLTLPGKFETRAEGEDLHISGYFAVFNSVYQMGEGLSESIAPGAFGNSLGGDIRALINHDTTLVLGRNKAGTLTLKEDDHGLWGDITINPKDGDAMNIRERVLRGDVDQCSIGFEIMNEETEFRDDGSVHWTIREARLWEVSVCTFPAYTETSVKARSAERDEMLEARSKAWKVKMQARLRGENNGVKSTDPAQEN